MANDSSRTQFEPTISSSPSVDLQQQILDLKYGDHTCILYSTTSQQLRAVIPFFQEGFEEGDHCLYIVNEHTVEEMETLFEDAGVDVHYQKDRVALSIQTARDSFLKDGTFSVDEMLDFVDETIDAIRAEGFSGFRSSGEMTWILNTDTSPQEMIEYEACLNNILKDRRAVLLCQYNAGKFPAGIVQKILSTHPIAVVEDLVCSNPFYKPPELLLDNADTDQLVEWRIRQLQEYQQNQKLLQEKESLLEEIHHRVKNNMQVIKSFLSMQTRNIDSDEAIHAFEESIRRIGAMALVHEKLYQTPDLSDVDFEQYLRGLVGDITESSNQAEDVIVNVSVEDCTPDLDRCITCGLIINELVSNAFQHSFESTGSGTIDIEFGRADSDKRYLMVKDNGKGFSENFDPEDTNSTGLDIVNTLVGFDLDGTVKYENNDGARITITF